MSDQQGALPHASALAAAPPVSTDTRPNPAVARQARRRRLAPSPTDRPAAPRSHWRVVSSAITLFLLVAINVGLQLNRRYFDILSSGGYGVEEDLFKVQACESLGRVPDVLFLGSSRAENGEDAPVVDTVVQQQFGQKSLSCNLGMSGSTFETDYYAFKRMIEDGYAPRLMVENLFEFNINANGGVDTYGPALNHTIWLADASDAWALRTHWGSGPRGMLNLADYVAQETIPLYGDRIGIYKTLCGPINVGPCGAPLTGVSWACRTCYLHDPNHGWHPLTDQSLALKTPAEQQSLANELTYFRTVYLQRFQIITGWPPYLTKLVALAQAHHIQVALVVSPMHQLYRDLLPQSDWDAIMAYWRAFAQTYGVSFYDASQATGYTDGDFRDPHHLTVPGAERFSAWMAITFVGPMLMASSAASERPKLTRGASR